MTNAIPQQQPQGEIILYQPDDTVRLEVRLENETVWLTQAQMAELFMTTRNNITLHIGNVFREKELDESSVRKDSLLTAADGKKYHTKLYNLDVIISVGYRVKSPRGTRFRQWANQVIRDYVLRGYAVSQQIQHLEQRLDAHAQNTITRFERMEQTLADHQQKIDFFVRTNQPPVEGVFFEGQIFDAYRFVETLVKSARREVILIDNYVDASIFDLLEKRAASVAATIYTGHADPSLHRLQQLYGQQHGRSITVNEYNNRFHDRFLILDDDLYHFGASFKDLGRRLFAFERMGIDKSIILSQL